MVWFRRRLDEGDEWQMVSRQSDALDEVGGVPGEPSLCR